MVRLLGDKSVSSVSARGSAGSGRSYRIVPALPATSCAGACAGELQAEYTEAYRRSRNRFRSSLLLCPCPSPKTSTFQPPTPNLTPQLPTRRTQVHLAEYHGRSVVVKKLMSGARVGSSMPLSHPELAQLRNVSSIREQTSRGVCMRVCACV